MFIQAVINGVADGALIGLAALGLSLIYAVQKFPNVSQGGFIAVGAYLAYALSALFAWYFAVPLAIVAAFVFGAGIYYVSVRQFRSQSIMTLMVVTIGLEFVLDYAVALIWGTQLRSYPLQVSGQYTLGRFYITYPASVTVGAVALSVLILTVILKFTSLGRQMRALADNPGLAELAGIRRNWIIGITWGIVGSIACIAGSAVAIQGYMDPMMGWNLLLPSFAAAIVGGIGNLPGSLVGGVAIGVGMQLMGLVTSPLYRPVFAFIVIVFVLLARPQGIFSKVVRV